MKDVTEYRLGGMKIAVVQFSTIEDARRVIADALEGSGVSASKAARLPGKIVEELRDLGLLAAGVEQHFKASQVAKLLSRSERHIVDECKAGRFGPRVFLDGGGWLIPASGVQAWLSARVFFPSVVSDMQKEQAA